MVSEQFFTTSDGTRLNYVDIAKGFPLLCVNGFGASFDVMDPVIEILTRDFRFLELDPRGVGRSEYKGEVSIHQAARDIEEFRQFMGIEKILILGTSMGSAVTFSYIRQFGCEHIEKFVIGDMTPCCLNDENWKLGLYQGWYTKELFQEDLELMEKDYDHFMIRFLENGTFQSHPEDKRIFSGTKEEILERFVGKSGMEMATGTFKESIMHSLTIKDEITKKANRDYWKSFVEADFRPILKDINIPVAVVYADPGSLFSPLTAEYLKEAIPDCTLFGIPDSTHGSMGEKTDLYLGYVKDFCM